jgi:hypothetical protein
MEEIEKMSELDSLIKKEEEKGNKFEAEDLEKVKN